MVEALWWWQGERRALGDNAVLGYPLGTLEIVAIVLGIAAPTTLKTDPSRGGLDRDLDGIVCESNRAPRDMAPVPRR